MAILCIIVIVYFLFLFCLTVCLFSMISQGQIYVLNAGDDVNLECCFYQQKFTLFQNPVQWKKIQYYEQTEINILGVVKEPFESTGRFSVGYEPSPPQYMMGLTIHSKYCILLKIKIQIYDCVCH